MIAREDELYNGQQCGQVVIVRKKGGARVTEGMGRRKPEGYYRESVQYKNDTLGHGQTNMGNI